MTIEINMNDLPDDLDKQMELIGRFGIYDTKDNCWLGDEEGPKEFTHFAIARVASEVVSDQLGISPATHRFKPMALPENENWKYKDEVPVKRTTLKSLQRIENGVV